MNWQIEVLKRPIVMAKDLLLEILGLAKNESFELKIRINKV